MASKINYNNKAPFQTLEEIPDENKVNAADMNEIKQVVNTNADELNTAKEDIENLESGQGTASADITSLKNRVSTLETDNSTNKTNISNLEKNKVDKVKGKGLSTEDFTTELKSKLESLENYDDTEIKEDISNLESEQTEQDKQIDILLNALPSETQEAENLNLKGTIPVKFKEFKVSGNSKQDTREGKNLTNYKDFTNIDENNTIVTSKENDKITATIKTNGFGITDIERQLKPNTNYTAFCDFKFSKTFSGSYGLRVKIGENWGNTSKTGLINFSTTDIVNVRIAFYAGVPYTGEEGVLTVSNIRLYEGTYTKETIPEYEEYGAMPSPEFPSEIQNVEGDVNVTVSNKNLFTGLVKGISVNNMGEVVERDTSSVSNFIKVDFDKNSRYYLSGLTNTLNSYVSFYNKDKQYLGRTAGNPQSFISFNINSFSTKVENYEDIEDKNIKFIRVSQYEIDTSTGTIDDIDNLQIQLEPGTTATNYVEHQEQTVTFPLSEGQKLYKGDYLADYGIHHVREQVELDGTDFSLYSNQVAGRTIYMISAFSNNNNFKTYDSSILCNILKQGTSSNGSNYLNNNGSSGSLYVSIENSILGITNESTNEEKLQAFQNLIAETGFVYEGELAEEETEAYTEEQQEAYNQLKQLTAYEEETNIYSINEVSPVFTVTAVKDINSVITQLNTVLLERS